MQCCHIVLVALPARKMLTGTSALWLWSHLIRRPRVSYLQRSECRGEWSSQKINWWCDRKMTQKMCFKALGVAFHKGGLCSACLVFLYSDVMAGLRLGVFSDISQSLPFPRTTPADKLSIPSPKSGCFTVPQFRRKLKNKMKVSPLVCRSNDFSVYLCNRGVFCAVVLCWHFVLACNRMYLLSHQVCAC